jgi:hypothetical protein
VAASCSLPGWIGWNATHEILAAAALGLALLALVTPRVALPAPELRRTVDAFAGWRARGELPAVLGFVLLFRLPDLAMAPMIAPFWVDGGIPREEIAAVKSGIGFAATLAGAGMGSGLAPLRDRAHSGSPAGSPRPRTSRMPPRRSRAGVVARSSRPRWSSRSAAASRRWPSCPF